MQLLVSFCACSVQRFFFASSFPAFARQAAARFVAAVVHLEHLLSATPETGAKANNITRRIVWNHLIEIFMDPNLAHLRFEGKQKVTASKS